MKQPWHNRNNTKTQARHVRKPQKGKGKHRRHNTADYITFQEPVRVQEPAVETTYTSSATGKYKSRFKPNGKPGTKPEAVILDMDGTLENWDGFPNPHAMEYAKDHHAAGRVLIIVTARDHEWSYKRTHDWLRRHLDLPFVGPICRPADDERYACDFKKHVYDQLSVVYDVVSAIDDDDYVLGMWESIPGLDVVRTNYDYKSAKGTTRPSYAAGGYGTYGSANNTALREALADRYGSVEFTGSGTSQSRHSDLSIYEYDDDYDWDALEEEVSSLKYRQDNKYDWAQELEELEEHGGFFAQYNEIDGSLDLHCHNCKHPWFDHGIHGCTSVDTCMCDG